MPLDEYLFSKFVNYLKNNKKQPDKVINRTIYLDDLKQRLTIVSRAVTGKPIEIFPAEREGGYKNNNFFLPASVSIFPAKDQNLSFYLFRVLYLSVQKKLNFNWQHVKEQPLEISRQKATETSVEVLKNLFEEYPLAKELYRNFKDFFIKTLIKNK